MHLKADKAIESSTIYCPIKRVHADITDYYLILTGMQNFAKSLSEK